MIVSTWHHATAAVLALAGERSGALDAAWIDPAPLQQCRAFIDAGRTPSMRARRVLAERLRALGGPRAHPTAPPPLGARLLALWLLGADRALRVSVSRGLDARARAEVSAEINGVRARPELAASVAGWLAHAVRALRAPVSLACAQSLALELAGLSPTLRPDALVVERSLRVHGIRSRAARDIDALRAEPSA